MNSIGEIDKETKAWAEKAKSQGKIKFFGFSAHNNMEDMMLKAAKLGWIDGIMISYNFRLMRSDRMRRAVDACAKAGIGLSAMKTQGGGPVSVESEAELELAGRFLQKGFTDAQAKLKAVWEEPGIASICSQMPSMTVLMSNVAAALDQNKLSAAELDLLDRYAAQTASGYCAGCTDICESASGGPRAHRRHNALPDVPQQLWRRGTGEGLFCANSARSEAKTRDHRLFNGGTYLSPRNPDRSTRKEGPLRFSPEQD